MPELPEVETVKSGLTHHLVGEVIQDVIVRHHQLRWPIPTTLKNDLIHQKIQTLNRRGKYILMEMNTGTLILHLGMSGSLRMVTNQRPPIRHGHVDFIFTDQKILRYNDPRRFGAILWTAEAPSQHILIKSLGAEPLERDFTADYLKRCAEKRRVAIKSFIMDNRIVVGIGNIYAAESLFLAGIHPNTPAGQLSFSQYEKLVEVIQTVLRSAILQGGTTVKDFVNSEGKPGYFAQQLNVYGRAGLPCIKCMTPLEQLKLSQRSTVFCKFCQN